MNLNCAETFSFGLFIDARDELIISDISDEWDRMCILLIESEKIQENISDFISCFDQKLQKISLLEFFFMISLVYYDSSLDDSLG